MQLCNATYNTYLPVPTVTPTWGGWMDGWMDGYTSTWFQSSEKQCRLGDRKMQKKNATTGLYPQTYEQKAGSRKKPERAGGEREKSRRKTLGHRGN